MVLDTMAPFSKSGLQVLAGPLLKWDEMSLFDQLFAEGFEPEMSVLTWELTELLCNMVIVVWPSFPQTYLLRVVLAPEFLWFGLHWAGMPHSAQVSTYPSDLLVLLHSRPLAASVALHQNLRVGGEWKSSFTISGTDNYVFPPMVDVEYPPSPVDEDVEGVLPMESVEFVPAPGVYMDTMIRDISPDMNACGTVSASAPPYCHDFASPLPLMMPSL
ncbi:hypothetical protein N7463_005509 [Penicillium fimorum]|uniref:Uncharacterized protein n=1 Tax=Penicillium fimorum TaxID=1882269 RepID=A0A9W9XU64_9EURO|nr:hypothetical protein N7463_005509 [Penicillium fimorum]